jgi:hypothetical protein
MFRKTFIRLILVIALGTTALLALAVRKTLQNQEQMGAEQDGKNEESSSSKSNIMILESIGLSVIKASSK